ncbi:hypothetical protein [Selenomonas sp. AE3005]|uniref:hypothetical protein n=1 Tax=Selenomonas sp. AE3005 TaxID=1485543 RepID=UPI000482F7E0|nr:hypothetical protein [Selenomonas sp. AE3005]
MNVTKQEYKGRKFHKENPIEEQAEWTLEKALDSMAKQKFTGEYKGFKLSTAFDWMNNSPYIQAVNATDFRIDIYGSKKRILSAIKGIDKQIDKKN